MNISSGMTAAQVLGQKLPFPLKRLADLAYNYWWSWTSDRITLFQTIDPQEWERCGHNPVAILEAASYERLTQLAEDPFTSSRLQHSQKSLMSTSPDKILG